MDDKMRVLMVDDKPENLFVLETLLQEEDIIMDKATSGNEALEMLLENDYALVLMDVQMPGIDGFETVELMKGMKKTKYIPIIFITAISKEEHFVFQGYFVGAVDYIYKPIEPMILKSKVRVFAELHKQKAVTIEQSQQLNEKVNELQEVKKQLLELNKQLLEISNRDALTGIANRRAFDEMLHKEWLRSDREETELAALMIDIDYFKNYNDFYGHLRGDEALIAVSHAIEKSIKRPIDFAARFGGEEFSVILPNTGIEGAINVSERILREVTGLKIENRGIGEQGILTVSVGMTVKDTSCLTAEKLVDRADRALYRAKREGRNRCCMFKLELDGLPE
ncbi:diguanylate cyclase [Eubacteriaceae bacterium ES3]|nr:diguanylate cyclase [Eubacteriaceae bacterium ES3]